LEQIYYPLELIFHTLISVPNKRVTRFFLAEKNLSLIFVIALFAASAALFVSAMQIKTKQSYKIKKLNHCKLKIMIIGIPVGAVLGVVAGLVGIGGGIWLSPLLILTGLAAPKRAAATAAFFILTNSVVGFLAHSISGQLMFLCWCL
jgi:uncharacterized membrane protein YfcA